MGGGHGFFTNRFGLGVDNVLEFEVVLPTGTLAVANSYLNRDLFWALRGGGGGTFGIVTKVTMKAHPSEDLNGVHLGVKPNPLSPAPASFARGMAELLSFMPNWTDWGISGHPIMFRDQFNTLLTAPGRPAGDIEAFMAPYIARLRARGLVVWLSPLPSAINSATIAMDLGLNAFIPGPKAGDPAVMGSRLWGRAGLADVAGLESALVALFAKNYVYEPFLVAGGAVARNRNLDIALNPMWRDAVVHMSILPLDQSRLQTVGEVQKSYKSTQRDVMDHLDRFSVGGASYLNEVS